MNQEKIYYNTEYRKKVKALSKFNIFIKDRISKRDEIQEIRLKKKKRLIAPLFYYSNFKLYFLIKLIYNKWIYKKKYDLKLSLKFSLLKKENFFYLISLNNLLVLEYFLNGIIYFFLILNWLWISEWNKWASLTDILEKNFLNLSIMYQYINYFFIDFILYLKKVYKILFFDFFYNFEIYDNYINVYNIYIINELYIFSVLYNIEEIKFEHDKSITPKNKWKDIKKVSFDYLKFDILNNYYYLSFFSFGIYEFYVNLNNKYNIHYITLTFFEYWINIIIEKNVDKYTKFSKSFLNFKLYNLKNLDTKIFKKKFFAVRVKYNFYLSNLDYFIFLKGLTFNFYIRNCNYFFEHPSQRKLFLKYNNPTSLNKGSISIWDYDKLYKKLLLLYRNDINNNFTLFNIERIEPFFNFYNRRNNKYSNYVINFFLKDLNVKLLYKINFSKSLFFSINKFYNFNLIEFYNFKNRLDSYKNVMLIDSVYEYRFANSSFKTMDEFIVTIFKTPLENYLFFNDLYKQFSYNIVYKMIKGIEEFFFFQDFNNLNNQKYFKNLTIPFKYFNRLFKTWIYFFKFHNLLNLINYEEDENLLKIDVFSRFYDIFEKKKMFLLLHKFKRNNFFKKWSIRNNFNILKFNTMFYLDVNNMMILFSGWLYDILFFSRYMVFIKLYNKIIQFFNFYDYYRYIMNFKDFFFQLVYENIEYSLIYLLIYIKKIKKKENFNYINMKHKINNNFIYRKYMLYAWLENNYYNDLFDNLKFFAKGNYSIKLSKWILRYFYDKSELYMFYSESLRNNYINKNRLFV